MIKPTYTKTPNEIFEAMDKMSDSELRVTLALVRLTHGYHRPDCKVNYDQLQDMTGLSRGGVASGIAATGARGFFDRFGRSGWRSLVYSVDQNSLTDRPTEDANSLLSRPKQSISQTDDSLTNRPNIGGELNKEKEKKRKKSIYTNGIHGQELPTEAIPFPEEAEKVQEMISALSNEVKETYAIGFTEESFEKAAEGLIKQGLRPEEVRGFSKWWNDHGHYKGKPALRSLLMEIGNYLNGTAVQDEDAALLKAIGAN